MVAKMWLVLALTLALSIKADILDSPFQSMINADTQLTEMAQSAPEQKILPQKIDPHKLSFADD